MPEIKLSYNIPIQILESEKSIAENMDFMIQGIAINATTTGNNHKFLAEELRESAGTLTGVPLLVDHRNEVSAIKGRVTIGEYDEQNSRINFKASVVDNEIKNMVRNGLINSVSVGAAVREIEEKDDVLIPRGITFKELSLVAVPADGGANFTTALQEAYKLVQEADLEKKAKEDWEGLVKQMEMEKCPECDKMIPKDKMKAHMSNHEDEEKLQSPKKETLQSLKGGSKMSEEIIETKKEVVKAEVPAFDLTELKAIQKDIADKLAEMKTLSEKKEAKAEVKPMVHEEDSVQEIGKYKIVQGFGSIRGASFTLVR